MCHARAVRSDGIRPERSELTRNDDGRPAPGAYLFRKWAWLGAGNLSGRIYVKNKMSSRYKRSRIRGKVAENGWLSTFAKKMFRIWLSLKCIYFLKYICWDMKLFYKVVKLKRHYRS